jgi:hypothetical protein
MTYVLLLLSSLLFGLVLLVIGAVLLLKVKNKIAGILVIAVGLLFTLATLAGFMALVITTRTMG